MQSGATRALTEFAQRYRGTAEGPSRAGIRPVRGALRGSELAHRRCRGYLPVLPRESAPRSAAYRRSAGRSLPALARHRPLFPCFLGRSGAGVAGELPPALAGGIDEVVEVAV